MIPDPPRVVPSSRSPAPPPLTTPKIVVTASMQIPLPSSTPLPTRQHPDPLPAHPPLPFPSHLPLSPNPHTFLILIPGYLGPHLNCFGRHTPKRRPCPGTTIRSSGSSGLVWGRGWVGRGIGGGGGGGGGGSSALVLAGI
ncbi:unnamed protein product [Dicrocoelium dendriticum]|nr:unnamed protein product [Dicrocoelium dendriticum]